MLATGLLAGLLAACSSGSSDVVAPPTATALSPSTPAPGTPSATASASPSPTPLSRFEDDPAVQALRVQYVGLAKLVNARTDQIPELKKTSTPARFKLLKPLFRKEFGGRYPGPIPFTPVSVTHASPTRTTVVICVLGDGWLRDARTGKPTLPRKVSQGSFTMLRVDGAWKADVAKLLNGSCDGVPIPEVYFP